MSHFIEILKSIKWDMAPNLILGSFTYFNVYSTLNFVALLFKHLKYKPFSYYISYTS